MPVVHVVERVRELVGRRRRRRAAARGRRAAGAPTRTCAAHQVDDLGRAVERASGSGSPAGGPAASNSRDLRRRQLPVRARRRGRVVGLARRRRGPPRAPPASGSTGRRRRRRPAVAADRAVAPRAARSAGTAPYGPPLRGDSSNSSPSQSSDALDLVDRALPSRATGRCPRCAAPRRRRGGGRTASCRARCGRRRRGGSRSATGQKRTRTSIDALSYAADALRRARLDRRRHRRRRSRAPRRSAATRCRSSRRTRGSGSRRHHDPATLARVRAARGGGGHQRHRLPRDLLHQPGVRGRRDLRKSVDGADGHRAASRRPIGADVCFHVGSHRGHGPRRGDAADPRRARGGLRGARPTTAGCCSRTPPAPATRSAATSPSWPP